eukprot:Gb_02366 [translate_table: standard]
MCTHGFRSVMGFIPIFFFKPRQPKVCNQRIQIPVQQHICSLHISVNDGRLCVFVQISKPSGNPHRNLVALGPCQAWLVAFEQIISQAAIRHEICDCKMLVMFRVAAPDAVALERKQVSMLNAADNLNLMFENFVSLVGGVLKTLHGDLRSIRKGTPVNGTKPTFSNDVRSREVGRGFLDVCESEEKQTCRQIDALSQQLGLLANRP